MFLACFAVFGTNKADILAFCIQILIAVQQIANIELIFRLVIFQTKDLSRFVTVGAEIAVAAGKATLHLYTLGQASLKCGECLFPSMADCIAPIIFAVVGQSDTH